MSSRKVPGGPYIIIDKYGYCYPTKLQDDKLFYFVNIRTGKKRRYRSNASACNFCANYSMPNWSSNAAKYRLEAE
jgi:hypothetical protein